MSDQWALQWAPQHHPLSLDNFEKKYQMTWGSSWTIFSNQLSYLGILNHWGFYMLCKLVYLCVCVRTSNWNIKLTPNNLDHPWTHDHSIFSYSFLAFFCHTAHTLLMLHRNKQPQIMQRISLVYVSVTVSLCLTLQSLFGR